MGHQNGPDLITCIEMSGILFRKRKYLGLLGGKPRQYSRERIQCRRKEGERGRERNGRGRRRGRRRERE